MALESVCLVLHVQSVCFSPFTASVYSIQLYKVLQGTLFFTQVLDGSERVLYSLQTKVALYISTDRELLQYLACQG